jgi:hypothetical protein
MKSVKVSSKSEGIGTLLDPGYQPGALTASQRPVTSGKTNTSSGGNK